MKTAKENRQRTEQTIEANKIAAEKDYQDLIIAVTSNLQKTVEEQVNMAVAAGEFFARISKADVLSGHACRVTANRLNVRLDSILGELIPKLVERLEADGYSVERDVEEYDHEYLLEIRW